MIKVVENTASNGSSERCLNSDSYNTLNRSDFVGLPKSLEDASFGQAKSPVEILSMADEGSSERDLDDPSIDIAELPGKVQHVKQIVSFECADLKLPKNFKVEQAIGGGDCFFDSVAQTLRQFKPNMEFTVKSLRQVCRELALSDQQLRKQVIQDATLGSDGVTPPQSGINDDELWCVYLASIEYTAEDIEEMKSTNPPLHQALTGLKYGSTLQVPIWGRVEIEGRLICRKYNVKLHVIESNPLYAHDKQQEPFLHQLIDDSGSRNLGEYNKVDYTDSSILHIINKGDFHFKPILSTREIQYSTPHSKSPGSRSLNPSSEKQKSSTPCGTSHARSLGEGNHAVSARSRKRAHSIAGKDDSAPKRPYVNSESFLRSEEASKSVVGNNKKLRRKPDSSGNSYAAQNKRAQSDRRAKDVVQKNFFVELIKEFEPKKSNDHMVDTIKKLVKGIFPYYENSCLTRFLLGQFLFKNWECIQAPNKHLLLYPDNEDLTFLLVLQGKAVFLNIIKNTRKEPESGNRVPKDLLPDMTSFVIDLSHSLIIDMIEKEGEPRERFSISIRCRNNIKEGSKFKSIPIDKEVISANSLAKSMVEKNNKSIKKITSKLTNIIYQVNLVSIFQDEKVKFSLIRDETDFKAVFQGLLINDRFIVSSGSNTSDDTRADLIVHSSDKEDALLIIKLAFNAGENLGEAELQLKQYINDLRQEHKAEKFKGLVLSYNENEEGQGEEKRKITYKYFFHSNNEIGKISLRDTLITSDNCASTSSDPNNSSYLHTSVLPQRKQRNNAEQGNDVNSAIAQEELVNNPKDKEIYINFLEREGYACISSAIARGKPKAFNRITTKDKSKEESVKTVIDYGCSDLHLAAANKNLDRLKELISNAENKEKYVRAKNNYGDTSLHFAAQMSSVNIVKELVNGVTDKERYIQDRNNHDHTALHFAAQNDNLQIVEELINCIEKDEDKEKYVKAQGKSGLTALHFAAQSGAPQIVEKLISLVKDKKSYVATKNEYGNTPLHFAAYYGHENIVEKLMGCIGEGEGQKEYITARNEFFNTPLHLAAYSGYDSIIRILINYIKEDKEEYVTTKNKFFNTSLHLCSSNDNPKILGELIDYIETDEGKEKHATTSNRRDYTPLHYVSKRGVAENIEKLISLVTDKESYVTAVNKRGYIPLHFLAQVGNLEIIEKLVNYIKKDKDRKEHVNTRNKLAYTPLHYAAYSGHKDVVEFLLRSGADVNAKNKDNLTILHLAACRGHKGVVKILLSFGAEINAKDKDGLTPIDLAKKNNKLDIVEYIKKNWISVNTENENGEVNTFMQADISRVEESYSDLFEHNTVEKSSNGRNSSDNFQSPFLYASSVGLSNVDDGNSSSDVNSEKSISKGLKNVQLNGKEIPSSLSSASESSAGQESDFEQDNAVKECLEQSSNSKQQNSSWKSGLGENDSQSNSSGSQEGKQPTSNDINEESSSDAEGVYSSPEREEGSCLSIPNLHDLGDTNKNYDNTLLQSSRYTEKNSINVQSNSEEREDATEEHSGKGNNLNDSRLNIGGLVEEEIGVNASGNTVRRPVKDMVHFSAQNTDDVICISDDEDDSQIPLSGRDKLFHAAREGNFDEIKGANYNIINAKGKNGNTFLFYAAVKDRLDVVKELIKNGANVNVKNDYGNTPLFCAVNCRCLDIVKELIKNGANVNVKNNYENTPLFLAACYGHLDVVKTLISNGAYFDVKNTSGKTPLDVSEDNHHLKVSNFLSNIKKLFHAAEKGKSYDIRGLAVNAKNSDGDTPLHIAAYYGYLDTVETLISNGAGVNARNSNGDTPLHIAAKNSCLSIVKILVENGAYFDVKNTSGQTPLDVSKDNNNSKVSKFLSGIKNLFDAVKEGNCYNIKGLAVNARNSDGDTPLLLAARCGYLNVVKNLIENGAYFDVKNTSGKTPLDVSKDNNNPEVSKFLSGIKNLFDAAKEGNCYNIKGLTAKARNSDGDTPLLLAVMNGNLDVIEKYRKKSYKNANKETSLHFVARKGYLRAVEKLIKNGADVNARNRGGDTPLHVVARCDYLNVVKNLIENGAYFDVKNTSGQTPLDVSKDNNHSEVSKFLSDIKELFHAAKKGKSYDIKGLAVNARNSDGDTPLLLAARCGYLNVVKNLIENGAYFDVKNTSGQTPLDVSKDNNHSEVSKFLSDIKELFHAAKKGKSYDIKGLAVNARNSDGDTPLLLAVRNDKLDVIDKLIKNGADISISNKNGDTVICICGSPTSLLAIEKLTKKMNPIISRSCRDNIFSFMRWGAMFDPDDLHIIKDFIKKIDIDIRDYNGNTLLHLAVQHCPSEIVRFLLEAGADKDAENDSGKTPLDLIENTYLKDSEQITKKIKELFKTKYEKEIELFDRQQRAHLCLEEQEQARSHSSESASNRFQNTSTVDNGKGSYGSSSSTSGFESSFSTFLDRQSTSKRGGIAKSGSKLSSSSTRTEQKQSSGSSKQNVSEVTKSDKSSIREALCWNESTSESSQSFLRSRSVSGKLSATGMSSSRPSTSLDNLQTEKHTAFSRSIGKS